MVTPIAGGACPYLGRRDDPDNYYGFATDGNCCYAGQRPVSIDNSFQEATCLGQGWAACPRYQAAASQVPPGASSVPPVPKSVSGIFRTPWVLVAAVAAAGLLLAVWLLVLRPGSSGDQLSSATSTLTVLQSQTPTRALSTATPALDLSRTPEATIAPPLPSPPPSATPAPTASSTSTHTPVPTSTPTATATPRPTSTPTATPAPIIYVIKTGDNLSSIALQFGVTVQEIQSANGIADPRRLRVGQQIIIPAKAGTGEPTAGLSPTAGPSPTPRPTRPASTPALLPAPTLLAPPDRQEFVENAEIVLVWQPVGELPADAYYAISVAYLHEGKTWYDEVPWTRSTSWSLSQHRYLLDLSDDGQFRWSVQVVRQTGQDASGKPAGLPLSAPSPERTLTWTRTRPSGGGGGATPTVPPP